jgi:hypothetical protein
MSGKPDPKESIIDHLERHDLSGQPATVYLADPQTLQQGRHSVENREQKI